MVIECHTTDEIVGFLFVKVVLERKEINEDEL
jgi:hypothetical protein